MVGCVAAEASGGKFKHGFIAAGTAQLAAPAINRLPTRAARVMAAATVGGTASKLGGGKFANGAGYSRVWEDCSMRRCISEDSQERKPIRNLSTTLRQ